MWIKIVSTAYHLCISSAYKKIYRGFKLWVLKCINLTRTVVLYVQYVPCCNSVHQCHSSFISISHSIVPTSTGVHHLLNRVKWTGCIYSPLNGQFNRLHSRALITTCNQSSESEAWRKKGPFMKREHLEVSRATRGVYCIIWPLKTTNASAACDPQGAMLPNDSRNSGGKFWEENGNEKTQLQVDNRCVEGLSINTY